VFERRKIDGQIFRANQRERERERERIGGLLIDYEIF
jgi:hypothetical protein